MRTDDNNNPTAFTTAIAEQAGLELGTEYETGTVFLAAGIGYHTAKLIGDPIALTIKVIDKIGFKNLQGRPRWVYVNFFHFVWLSFTYEQKLDTIGAMYQNEGGTAMRHLFPNYGKV